MKHGYWLLAALISVTSGLGCLAPATQEDIDALEQEEALDEVAAHEESLAIDWDSPVYRCDGNTCTCRPGTTTSETTCEGFVSDCGRARIYCCTDRRSGPECTSGYNELAQYCWCTR